MNLWTQQITVIGKIALVFILLGFISLFLMDKLVLPLYTRHGQEQAVPNLVGLLADKAERIAKKQGYRFLPEKIVPDDQVPLGTVIEQLPPPGTITKSGRLIRAIVSGGEKLIPMPRLIGISPQGALNTATSLGFVIPQDSIQYQFSDRYPQGVVFQQSISQDSLLHKGAIIGFTVSLGSEPLEFHVPKLLGESLNQAKRILNRSGLELGAISFRFTTQYPESTVIGQSIKSKTVVEKGTLVDVLVTTLTPPELPISSDFVSQDSIQPTQPNSVTP
jgi:beta-lactam-binding protein with PASTA domain